MPPERSRIWLGLGVSILAADLALPLRLAKAACLPSDQPPQGEAGEGGGEAGGDPAPRRVPVLDRMAAQIAAADELTASGDTESADMLAAAAADEGLARLERLAGSRDQALAAQVEPLASDPGSARARAMALRGIEDALAAGPDSASSAGRIGRAAALAGLALEAYGAALNCDGPVDRLAYAETRALVRRAHGLLEPATDVATAREMAGFLTQLVGRLPFAPPEPMPPLGEISALVSRTLLAAKDVAP